MNNQETYTYIKNTPKNTAFIKLPVKETFIYGYNYATYKPAKHNQNPEPKLEKKWSGVI